MIENLVSSLYLTVIGLTVVFLVLGLLMASITVLNRLLPYVEPIAMETPSFAISAVDEETVAVIHTALATYLQRAPGKLIITPADRQ